MNEWMALSFDGIKLHSQCCMCKARSQVSWWRRIWMKQQQQLVQPAGVLIPAKYVLSWSQNAMRINHVLILHKCSPLLTPKMLLPLLLFSVLWQVVFSIQIFTNSQDSGIFIQHAFKTWPRRQRVLQKGYHVEHFFIWHHCSCSAIPSTCNTTTTT